MRRIASHYRKMAANDPAPHRILVADDQPDVLEALRLLLKAEGYLIDTAKSPGSVARSDRFGTGSTPPVRQAIDTACEQ